MSDLHERDPQLQGPNTGGFFSRLWSMMGLAKHPNSLEDIADTDADMMRSDDQWSSYFRMSADRTERYRLFEEMDSFGIVAAILDLYSEETTQPDYDKQRSVWIESKNAKVVKAGDDCLRNIRIEDTISAIVREVCKNGDSFRRLIYATEKGVLGWKYVDAVKVHRVQDKFDRLIGYREDGKKFRGERKRAISWPWDYVHYRLLGRNAASEYGSSLLEPMFRSWRSMSISEDALIMLRLRRASDRNIVYVDVGEMEEHDAINYVNLWRKKFRKHEFIDPSSKDYKKRYNPLTPVEDVFMPVRGEQGLSKVESLAGMGGDLGAIYDIDHHRRMFMGAAKVPGAYAGFEGEINAKSTLMQQDVRFARTCKRIRRAAIYGTRMVVDTHLALLPQFSEIQADKMAEETAYVLQMSPISYLDEFERLELIQLRYEIVNAMSTLAETMQIDPKVWATYILTDFAKLPEDMVLKLVAKTGAPLPPEEMVSPQMRMKILQEHGPDALRQIVEPMGVTGHYGLSKEEQRKVAECIHKSPMLRKVISEVSEYYEDDLQEMALRQQDFSLCPPIVDGKPLQITDDYKDDTAAKTLLEDIASCSKPPTENEKSSEAMNDKDSILNEGEGSTSS